MYKFENHPKQTSSSTSYLEILIMSTVLYSSFFMNFIVKNDQKPFYWFTGLPGLCYLWYLVVLIWLYICTFYWFYMVEWRKGISVDTFIISSVNILVWSDNKSLYFIKRGSSILLYILFHNPLMCLSLITVGVWGAYIWLDLQEEHLMWTLIYVCGQFCVSCCEF